MAILGPPDINDKSPVYWAIGLESTGFSGRGFRALNFRHKIPDRRPLTKDVQGLRIAGLQIEDVGPGA